jgi:hypothetical protein
MERNPPVRAQGGAGKRVRRGAEWARRGSGKPGLATMNNIVTLPDGAVKHLH